MSRAQQRTIEINGSDRSAPEGAAVAGELDPDALLALTVHFRRRTPAPPPGSAEDLKRLMRPMTRAALARERARTHARAAARIAAFARAHGITVRNVDLTSRCMVLEAPAGLLMQMFGATVHLYYDGTRTFRARTGALRIPREIAPWIRAVVGFDQRPLARRQPDQGPSLRGAVGAAADGLWPTEVATLYGIPLDRDVTRHCVGIVAMGGGYQASDLALALTGMGRQPPAVIDQSVGGVTNQYSGGSRDDQEIALDLQVLAGLLPGARIVVYFTGNTAEALANAIDQAVRDDVNRPQVLSISWGSPEFFWTAPRREVMSAALCDAARLRISVIMAAGDQLATSGMTDGKAHVWFPASSPYVVGCGGTAVALTNSGINDETVWNEVTIGTGGGISDVYPVPDFQTGVALPPSVNDGQKRRGVPDVAALAAKSPGYRIVIGGEEIAMDGTSAATPLLYAIPASMRPVVIGNNRQNGIGYAAGTGWNACTGLGVPRGAAIVDALASIPMA
jgi:kumamolisin